MLVWLKLRHSAVGWKYHFARHSVLRSDGGTFALKPGLWIECGATLQAIGGRIDIGHRVFINVNSQVMARAGITIEDDALIADHCTLVDHDHDLDADPLLPWGRRGYAAAPIRIGRGAWIGSHAVILKGVTVGDHAVIAAGSVVNKSVPPFEIWGGVPARKLRVIPQPGGGREPG